MTDQGKRLNIPPQLTDLEQVPIDELRPDPVNPRQISREQLDALTESIRRFGFVQPVLARRENQVVIGGHQRLVAARRLGYSVVPVLYLDLTVEEAHTLNLALNRISGDWDRELLGRLLSELAEVDSLDLGLTGFAPDEIEALIRGVDQREKRHREENFDVEAALKTARRGLPVACGDLWALGSHRLLCGDACDPSDVARLMEGSKAAMCFTDPPYNVALGDHGGRPRGQRRRKIANDDLEPEAWEAFVRACATNIIANVVGALYICMSSKEWPLVSRVLQECGGHWSDTIIWAKDQFVLGRADYQRQFEPIWYGWPTGSGRYWCGDRDQGDVWQIGRPLESESHPTMKPLKLIERAIENSSRPGDLVADFFLGSGSTLIACERTGRVCYGMELEPYYAWVGTARWESFTGLTARKIG